MPRGHDDVTTLSLQWLNRRRTDRGQLFTSHRFCHEKRVASKVQGSLDRQGPLSMPPPPQEALGEDRLFKRALWGTRGLYRRERRPVGEGQKPDSTVTVPHGAEV